MILVLSPAKTLDFDSTFTTPSVTKPIFFEDSLNLVKSLKSMTQIQLGNLFKISDSLAKLNFNRYQNFSSSFNDQNYQPAIISFRGDVYKAFDRDSFTEEDYTFAQEHVRILSGLYGILKPLDAIQPYRLEMGTKLANSRGKNLYSYWKKKVTEDLTKTLQKEANPILLNLASKEYMSVINVQKLGFPVITIIFKEERKEKLKVIPIQAKRARGIMTNCIVKNKIDSPEKLFDFAEDRYKYQCNLSSESEYVFVR